MKGNLKDKGERMKDKWREGVASFKRFYFCA